MLLGASVHADREIRSAPPADDVLRSKGFWEQLADGAQYDIAGAATEGVGEAGEGVDLKDSDRVRIGFSPRQPQKAVDLLRRFVRYRQTRQRIRLHRGAPRLHPGEAVLDPHHQLGRDEWLTDVIVRARGEHPLHTRLIRVARQKNHGQLAPAGIGSSLPGRARSR